MLELGSSSYRPESSAVLVKQLVYSHEQMTAVGLGEPSRQQLTRMRF